jgi:hypothetical protein
MAIEAVKTTHHETPLMLRETGGILRADPRRFKGHSDDELILLESLVGREPPFVKSGVYPANNTDYPRGGLRLAGQECLGRSFRKRAPCRVGRMAAWSRSISPRASAIARLGLDRRDREAGALA